MEPLLAALPRAFAALEQFPALRDAVAASLRRQRAHAAACLAAYAERPRLVAAITAAARGPRGGLISVVGPPGSGVTSLLAALAARHPWPLWLPDSAPDGLAACYAQLVALHRPSIPLLDPTAASDPAALEQLLSEAAATAPGPAPIVLLIDALDPPGQPLGPGPVPLPAELPPGVVLLLGGTPGAPLPYPLLASFQLPDADPDLLAVQARALAAQRCPPAWVEPLCDAAAGNFLYLRLALAALRAGTLALHGLPAGLTALLEHWWAQLAPAEQRLAALLAAAAEPLPLSLALELVGSDPQATLAHWANRGLIDLEPQAASPAADGPSAPAEPLACFTHRALAAFVGQVAPAALDAAHADLAAARLRHAIGAPDASARYLERQFARHAALAPGGLAQQALPGLISRDWLRAHERRAGLAGARDDARWELRAAATAATPLRLVRAAACVGLLTTRSRSLTPAAAAEALQVALQHHGREPTLKRVLESVERLPDGYAKATVLRRLGEVCYAAGMRSAAMRLLSRALDLEENPTSRAWRDTREALLVALASAALKLDAVDVALAIAERIEHRERRAMLETQVVRQLLATGALERAQRLARAVLHESMGAWARAEVAVALSRHGDPRGALMLQEISLETVAAWAQIELACDEVLRDEAAARRRIDALPTQGQRDRGLARLARTLAAAGDEGAALAAAEAIVGVDSRVAALIDLRLNLEGLVATLALERATRDIGAVTGDERTPLVAALAAALAALGRHDQALAVAHRLPAGEERDRALARVTVALAQRGEHQAAGALLQAIDDADERAWAYEEFARLLAAAGRWDEAVTMTAHVATEEQQARARADLAVERARAGEPPAALAMARAVAAPAERARALSLIAPLLVAGGAAGQALALLDDHATLVGATARGRYQAAVAAALAEHGQLAAAATVVATIRRPADRARAGAALAHALASHDPQLAQAVLGETLRVAAVGRDETLRALELAVPALAALGGAALLEATALAVDEVDRWL